LANAILKNAFAYCLDVLDYRGDEELNYYMISAYLQNFRQKVESVDSFLSIYNSQG